MVIAGSTRRGRLFKFVSAAVAPEVLKVTRLEGREEISQPYRWEIELLSDDSAIDPAAVLESPAYLGMKQGVSIRGSVTRGVQNLRIHGILSSFEQCERGAEGARYRAVLVPRLWRLSLNVQSRIFQDRTTPEIVAAVLEDSGLTSVDYEFRTSRPYPKHEYTVQHQESDLHFISRLLEHEGIFYYFLQEEEREQIVFGDSVGAHDPIRGDLPVEHLRAGLRGAERVGREWHDPELVYSLTCRHELIPKSVVMRDFNYRSPSVDLKVEAAVPAEGPTFGTVYEYGAHYKNTDEGTVLAKIRAEELKCRERLFSGTGECKSFRAGALFRLEGNERSDFNRSYLLTAVTHRAKQGVEMEGSVAAETTYENEFTALAGDVVFRPERRTPKPRISGTLNAKVDAAGDGHYAEIDGQGRYKVKIPFDLSGIREGMASRYIRMAQPYSGAGYGHHFPLHKSAEVIVTHVNGDPDRPIIAGAVPNPETKSPVTGENQTQCRMVTGGQNEFTIEDQDDSQYFYLSTPGHKSFLGLGTGHSLEVPGGAVIGTEEGVSVSAGKSVSIAAGAPEHPASIGTLEKYHLTLEGVATLVGGICASASKIASEKIATGQLAKVATAAEILGAAMGAVGTLWSHTNVYVTSPSKIVSTAGGEIILQAVGVVELFAGGCANLTGGLGVYVGSPLTASVIAGKKAEMISIWDDVLIEAKKRGNVEIEAKGRVKIEAQGVMKKIARPQIMTAEEGKKAKEEDEERKKSVLVIAEKGSVHVDAKEDEIWIESEKGLHVRTRSWPAQIDLDTETKEIRIKTGKPEAKPGEAGTSSIVLKDGQIVISADTIILQDNKKKSILTLNDALFTAQAEGKLNALAKQNVLVSSEKEVLVYGKDAEVKLVGKPVSANGKALTVD